MVLMQWLQNLDLTKMGALKQLGQNKGSLDLLLVPRILTHNS